jgi:hypothetical protein
MKCQRCAVFFIVSPLTPTWLSQRTGIVKGNVILCLHVEVSGVNRLHDPCRSNGLRTAIARRTGHIEGGTREVTSVTVQKSVEFGVDGNAVGVTGARSHI